MIARVQPGPRWGRVKVPASKSQLHRLLILSSLCGGKISLEPVSLSGDILATARCLKALGAEIEYEGDKFISGPIESRDSECILNCGESGSTLRFLLPLAGALGRRARFITEGRLAQRPLDALASQLIKNGMDIRRQGNEIFCSGTLRPGDYTLPGGCSSQFISGLLMSLPLLDDSSRIFIEGRTESAPYITMTEEALQRFHIGFTRLPEGYYIPGNQKPSAPEDIFPEPDWSSAAFFLSMGALSPEGISLADMPEMSIQGDSEIVSILKSAGAEIKRQGSELLVKRGEPRAIAELDAAQIPDLVPALAALFSLSDGESRIINASRLRLKESDRLNSSCAMLKALGADIRETPDGLIIRGRRSLSGGETESFGDHRIAMAAAVAACGCENEVIIKGAECVSKSYPDFWRDFGSLSGGSYELLR